MVEDRKIFDGRFWGVVVGAVITGFLGLIASGVISINIKPILDFIYSSKSDWFIALDNVGYSSDYIPSNCTNKYYELINANEEIKQMAFYQEKFDNEIRLGCVILYGHNDWDYAGYIPKDLLTHLMEYTSLDLEIKQILFTPNNGWIVIFGKNAFATYEIPDDLLEKLQELHESGLEIDHVAVAPNLGWVVFYEKNRFSFSNIPSEVTNTIADLISTSEEISQLAFAPDTGWIILHSKNEEPHDCTYDTGIPKTLMDRLKALDVTGDEINFISFSPSPFWN